jgi:8-oxo-dGTP pyrophosphatase MutT (NUDIX family)
VAGDRGCVELSVDPPRGTWLQRGERVLYDSAWVQLAIADVLLPDGTQVDHHLVRLPRPAAGTVIVADGAVLLMYRHRFITDTWGWEIPAGMVDDGETIAAAAIREALEESGWEPINVEPLCAFRPAVGVMDQTFHIFVTRDAVHRGDPVDVNEAARIEWHSVAAVLAMLGSGEINDGLSFGALSFALASGVIEL